MRTVRVNQFGRDSEGNDYGHVATKEAIDAGLCINEPVRLRYPDGSTTIANEVRMTPKGISKIAADMAAGRA